MLINTMMLLQHSMTGLAPSSELNIKIFNQRGPVSVRALCYLLTQQVYQWSSASFLRTTDICDLKKFWFICYRYQRHWYFLIPIHLEMCGLISLGVVGQNFSAAPRFYGYVEVVWGVTLQNKWLGIWQQKDIWQFWSYRARRTYSWCIRILIMI